MVVRRVLVIAETVHLSLVLVVPSRVNWTIATIFIWVRARVAAAVAGHTCLPSSVIVVKLSEFRVQTSTRIDKGVSAVPERVRVFVTV